MNGHCHFHTFESAVDVCDGCYADVCANCVVKISSRKNAVCKDCAIGMAGVRGSSKTQARGEKSTAKQRRAEHANGSPEDKKFSEFISGDPTNLGRDEFEAGADAGAGAAEKSEPVGFFRRFWSKSKKSENVAPIPEDAESLVFESASEEALTQKVEHPVTRATDKISETWNTQDPVAPVAEPFEQPYSDDAVFTQEPAPLNAEAPLPPTPHSVDAFPPADFPAPPLAAAATPGPELADLSVDPFAGRPDTFSEVPHLQRDDIPEPDPTGLLTPVAEFEMQGESQLLDPVYETAEFAPPPPATHSPAPYAPLPETSTAAAEFAPVPPAEFAPAPPPPPIPTEFAPAPAAEFAPAPPPPAEFAPAPPIPTEFVPAPPPLSAEFAPAPPLPGEFAPAPPVEDMAMPAPAVEDNAWQTEVEPQTETSTQVPPTEIVPDPAVVPPAPALSQYPQDDAGNNYSAAVLAAEEPTKARPKPPPPTHRESATVMPTQPNPTPPPVPAPQPPIQTTPAAALGWEAVDSNGTDQIGAATSLQPSTATMTATDEIAEPAVATEWDTELFTRPDTAIENPTDWTDYETDRRTPSQPIQNDSNLAADLPVQETAPGWETMPEQVGQLEADPAPVHNFESPEDSADGQEGTFLGDLIPADAIEPETAATTPVTPAWPVATPAPSTAMPDTTADQTHQFEHVESAEVAQLDDTQAELDSFLMAPVENAFPEPEAMPALDTFSEPEALPPLEMYSENEARSEEIPTAEESGDAGEQPDLIGDPLDHDAEHAQGFQAFADAEPAVPQQPELIQQTELPHQFEQAEQPETLDPISAAYASPVSAGEPPLPPQHFSDAAEIADTDERGNLIPPALRGVRQ